jgi:ATP-binding cassette subfamily B protein
MRQFTNPITQIASIINTIQATLAASERVFELLDAEEMEELKPEEVKTLPTPCQGRVSFERVKFGYTPEKPVIKDFSLEVQPGQMVAIVGPTGAGKTTLVNLLMRFYEINEGRIMIDGVDTQSITRQDLRKNFGMVLQDAWLFSGTIRENIAYGATNPTEENIRKAAKLAQADHFIELLPEGYDTLIREDGSNLSQGQRQLLTIARALLANPSIIILDEATSSIDTHTESLVQKAMHESLEGRTSFVIAHRLSTIRQADIILVIREGNIVEKGTHEELLAANGFYAELHNSQFVDCIDECD